MRRDTKEIKELFKEGMSKLAAAVTIVATDGEAGRGGITATAVCSVTDAPPTLLVCVNKDSDLNRLIKENNCFSVNLLRPEHEGLANRFAGFLPDITMEDRLLEGDWQLMETTAPLLSDALSSFDCKLSGMQEMGSHTVFFGEIQGVLLHRDQEAKALTYFQRGYREL